MTVKSVKPAARRLPATTLREAVLRSLDRRTLGEATLAFPCVPALLDDYMRRIAPVARALGRTFSASELAALRSLLEQALGSAFERAPQSLVVVTLEAPAPSSPLTYQVFLQERDVASYYDAWAVSEPERPLFGAHPDAKVMAVARGLDRQGADPRALDLGAGEGRNAFALAAAGFRVDAIELAGNLAQRLRERAAAEGVAVHVIQADVNTAALEPATYQLIVASELLTHLRSAASLRSLLKKLADALAPGGCVVANAFLPHPGQTLDPLVLQSGQVALSCVFRIDELDSALEHAGLSLVEKELALPYERAHQPASAWPPTRWYEDWASGRNIVDVPAGDSPVGLYWLVLRRR